MMATNTPMLIVLAIGWLVLNVAAFRQSARELNFERKAAMVMSWVVLFGLLALLFQRYLV